MNRLQKAHYLCKEIGIPQLVEYAGYQIAQKTGIVTKHTPPSGLPLDLDLANFVWKIPLGVPNTQELSFLGVDQSQWIRNAEEILSGFYHPFGGEKHLLSFDLQKQSPEHWSKYGDVVNSQDIKWIWEPARFTWAFDLARAYLVKQDERYPSFFWQKFSEFVTHNPVNCGPNWVSAQEAAMRILTWSMVFEVFKNSPTTSKENRQHLAAALWHHAARIPPTLAYARSQNNNHLLSEALGLIVAGSIFFERSARSKKWLKLGLHEFAKGLINQIEADGTYCQHSANYHRLMIQLSLLYFAYTKSLGVQIPAQVSSRLDAATRWLAAQLDSLSGRLPNLGHNDGTILLPMGCVEYRDYRPTLQAASIAFLGEACLPSGKWDELSFWLGLNPQPSKSSILPIASPAVHKITNGNSWATLRGVHFHGRPAHADQLHVEYWWEGINLALDAGTFTYNDLPPWQNALSSTLVHNTISIDEKDQMHRAGKFLWLRQAQARWLSGGDEHTLSAKHDGYRKIGVIHQRSIEFKIDTSLQVTDLLQFSKQSGTHKVTLHWLLPDWHWELSGQTLLLSEDHVQVEISITGLQVAQKLPFHPDDLSIIRGGEAMLGNRKNSVLGWVSDTYGVKKPALSFSATWQTNSNMHIFTNWKCSSQSQSRKG